MLRATVLVLGILGGLAAAFLGFSWYSDYDANRELIDAARELSDELGVDAAGLQAFGEIEGHIRASYVLMADLLVGILGGVLVFARKPVPGGVLMLAGVAVPAVLAPKSLVFTAILALAGVLALTVLRRKSAPT